MHFPTFIHTDFVNEVRYMRREARDRLKRSQKPKNGLYSACYAGELHVEYLDCFGLAPCSSASTPIILAQPMKYIDVHFRLHHGNVSDIHEQGYVARSIFDPFGCETCG